MAISSKLRSPESRTLACFAVPWRAALPKSALRPAHKHTGAFIDNTPDTDLSACVGVSRAADWGTNSKLRSLEPCSLVSQAHGAAALPGSAAGPLHKLTRVFF